MFRRIKSFLVAGLFLVIVAAIFIFAADFAKAGSLTSISVTPNTSNVDNLTGQAGAQWKFTMTNDTALEAGDVIQVVFPSPQNSPPFTFSSPAVIATTSATTSLNVAGDGNRTVAFSLLEPLAASTTFSVTMNGVENPLASLSNLANLEWIFRTGTTTTGIPTDSLTTIKDGPSTATASLTRAGSPIVSDAYSAITPSSYTASATDVTYTFTFTASTSIPIGGKIVVNFPSEYDLTNATTTDDLTDINGAGSGAPRIAPGAVTTATSDGQNKVILTTSGAVTNHNDVITVKVAGLTNPAKGVYRPMFVYTTNANGGLIDGAAMPGMDDGNYTGPPPIDAIHIGGNNTINVIVYKEDVSGATTTLSANDISQVKIGVGCPDKQFFVGFRYLTSGATTTFNNLLDCNYKIGTMPAEGNSFAFFQEFLQPGMTDVSAVGGVTSSIALVFGRPNAVWTGAITGGNASDTSGAGIMAFNSTYMTFSPIFTTTNYDTEGFDGSGNGYFKIKVKTGSSWKINFEGGVLTNSGTGNKYWPPSIPTTYASSTATTSLGTFAYELASNTLTVTLKNAATSETITTNTCVSVKRTGGGFFMSSQESYCDANSGNNYVFKVPTGAISVEIMRHGVGQPEEYPIAISGDTAKTIYIKAPTSYITVTVTDSESTAINGAPVFAHSSSGFGQSMTNSSGVATIYVPAGTYRAEGFAPALGPLTSQTGVVVAEGTNPSVTFTVDTSGYKTIQGTITQGGSPVSNMQVGARGYGITTGGNGTVTSSDGTYTLRVPAGTYYVSGWSESTGGLPEQAVNVTSANATGINWTLGAQGTLRIIVAGGANVSPLFGGAFDPTTGRGSGTDVWIASSTLDKYADLRLPAGTYEMRVGSPVTGELTCAGGSSVEITGGNTTTITCNVSTSATMVALTGNVTSGSPVANANVWVSRIGGSGFYSTLTDSSGNYSIKVPDEQSYMVGVKKMGYLTANAEKAVSGNSTQDFTLAAAGATITGKITSDGSTGIANSWISAKKTDSDTWTGTPTDAAGNYSLDVDSSSSWTIYAEGPCYYRSTGLSADAGDSSKNITLSAISGCSAAQPEIHAVTPATGGMVSNGSKLQVDIPANALGTGSDSVSVSIQDANLAVSTTNATPLKNSVQTVTATNSSGQTITSLNNKASLTIQYNESDLPPGFSESNLQLAYFDNTTGQWEPVAATVNTVLNTLTAQVDHFTDYSPILPGVPDQPQGLSASAQSTTQINLSWNTNSNTTYYNIYRSTTSGSGFSLIASTTGTSYSNTGLTAATAYYYKITAVNANGASAYSSEANATTNSEATSGGGGGGGISGDISAPIISQIAVSAGDTSVIITWTTNEDSISWIVYGASTEYGLEQKTTSYTTAHSLTLTGLAPNTTYHYQIKSKDSVGNAGYYTDKTFTTAAIPTTPTTPTAPSVSSGALAPYSAANITGYTLMKAAGSNNVWVAQNNLKILVRSIEVFNSSGYGSAAIKSISAASLDAVPTATLIKTEDNPDVYLLEKDFRRKLASIEIFNTYKLDWNKISIISQSVMSSFSHAPIYKHGVNLYWRGANNILHLFPSMPIFTAKGYNARDLIEINDMEFGSFAVGEQIAN